MTELARYIGNRKWLWRAHPFPHIVALDAFSAPFYAMLDRAVRSSLVKGLSETATGEQFSRDIPGYDAYGMGFDEQTSGAVAIFRSIEWHDLITGLFGVTGTRQVNLGAHHHTPGSAHGFIHNDFNPVWFPKWTARDSVCCSGRCDYKSGAGLAENAKVEVVRAVAMIYYLCNDGWRPGDGGETGLFHSATDSLERPAAVVTPVNNTMILFECTPHSYHSFLHNPGRPRTSIIMWAHRTMADKQTMWPDGRLERWDQ